jgi:SAM-dependent methyltransferase
MDYGAVDNVAWRLAADYLKASFGSSERKVCDVGCHTGDFLSKLPPTWFRFGIESSLEARLKSVESNGVELIGERIDTVPKGAYDGAFDAVSMFDVFEHLPYPVIALQEICRWLRPGGRLIVSTGNFDARIWRIAKGNYWYVQPELHLSFGSPTFFKSLANRLPLRPVMLREIPHRKEALRVKFQQTVEVVHWECQQRGGIYRVPQLVLQKLPSYRYLAHRRGPPWVMGLKDHMIVIFEKTP